MCKHDGSFRFLACTAGDRLPGVWMCEKCQAFSLNFDPTKVNRIWCSRDDIILIMSDEGIAYVEAPTGKKTLPHIDYKAG